MSLRTGWRVRNFYDSIKYMGWKNKEAAKAYHRKRYLENREEFLILAKENYRKNTERVKKQAVSWKRKNPEKVLISQRKWKKRNPDKLLAYKLRFKFGITIEEYRKMFEKQENRCAICWRGGETITKKLDVDHNHKTGKVRGLLCGDCNRAIGLFKDDIYRLSNAISYLRKYL